MTAVRESPTSGLAVGILWGTGIGLVLGLPTGVALRTAGYPSDKLYVWWLAMGAAYLLTLTVAVVLAQRHIRFAVGLMGATLGSAVAPALVILEILMNSE